MARLKFVLPLALSFLVCQLPAQQAAGTWSGLIDLGRRAIHVMVLKDGRILVMNRTEAGQEEFMPAIFKTDTGDYEDLELDKEFDDMNGTRDLFCSGHITGWDGTPYFFGGHKDIVVDGRVVGQEGQVYITTLENDEFVTKTDMSLGRWYPSTLRLPTGDIFSLMGHITNYPTTQRNEWPTLWGTGFPGQTKGDYKFEFYNPNNPSANQLEMDIYYPFVYVMPNGNIYYASRLEHYVQGQFDYVYDPVNRARIENSGYGFATGVSNVLNSYPSTARIDDIIIRTGGSNDPDTDEAVDRAIYLNFTDSAPQWQKAHSDQMVLPRKNHVIVSLPTGNFVAMNGNLKGNVVQDPENPDARTAPEVWDPFRPTRPWTLLAQPTNKIKRGYHGTAWLLPDGRVGSAGGDPPNNPSQQQVEEQQKMQIFSPPYGGRNDWASVRPVITSSPTEIYYGQTFNVTALLASPKNVYKIVLVGLPSVTHAYDQGGIVRSLSFTGGGTKVVSAPQDANVATPGYYMLFVVDNEGLDTDLSDGDQSALIPGIPSAARIVRLGYGTPVHPEPGQNQLSNGSYFNVNANVRELFLADNMYLGTYITTSSQTPAGTQLLIDGYAPAGTSDTNIHVLAEYLATSDASFKIEAYNWTSGYQQLYYNSSLSGNTERKIEASSSGSGDFINAADNNRVRIRLTWLDSDAMPASFQIKLDQVRMWLR